MITDVNIVTRSSFDIIKLEKAKKQLKIDADLIEEDDLIADYIQAAIDTSEQFIGGHIQEKEMTIKMDLFESFEFEAFPLQEITSIQYFEKNTGTVQSLPVQKYSLSSLNSKVFNLKFKTDLPLTEVRDDAVTVTIKVGYGDGKTPKAIIQALMLRVADFYERREDRGKNYTTTVAENLLRDFKKY